MEDPIRKIVERKLKRPNSKFRSIFCKYSKEKAIAIGEAIKERGYTITDIAEYVHEEKIRLNQSSKIQSWRSQISRFANGDIDKFSDQRLNFIGDSIQSFLGNAEEIEILMLQQAQEEGVQW